MAAANGITGDDTLNPEVAPDPVVDEGAVELKKAAAFVKSDEFAELKKYLLSRVDFYSNYLPNGTAIGLSDATYSEKGQRWEAATILVQEFKGIISAFESAAEQAADIARREV